MNSWQRKNLLKFTQEFMKEFQKKFFPIQELDYNEQQSYHSPTIQIGRDERDQDGKEE